MDRKLIPNMEWPGAFGNSSLLEEMAATLLETSGKGLRTFDHDLFNRKPRRVKVLFAFSDWHGDLNDIIDNVNISTNDLTALSERAELPARELWARYRLLVRATVSELYRVKEVTEPFFKDLKRLGVMDASDRRACSQLIRGLLENLIKVRNQITHKSMPVLEEERRAMLTVMAEIAGGVFVLNGTVVALCPAAEVGEIAAKFGSELHEMGEGLFDLLQRMSEAMATHIVEGDGWEN